MKLSSDASVNRLLHEGINNYEALTDFDTKSIERLPSICKNNIPAIVEDLANGIPAEAEVPGANVGSISVRRLLTAMHASKYYTSIGRTMVASNMHYGQVLSDFQLEWEDYVSLKEKDDPTVPSISDKDQDRRIIKWAPIFRDCLSRTYGSKGPLAYVVRDDATVQAEVYDPLGTHSYFGASGSLHDELIARLPHTGAIFKNDNGTVYMLIEKAARGTSVESTVKTFARRKDGRAAFLALIANHAGDAKYRSIVKKRLHLLQNIKWNGRSFPLESHVSNHRAAVDDLRECSSHITVTVPDPAQRVEYLIDSITCNDSTLQAAIGLVRANTNNMRNDFELAATALIEVDPYRRLTKSGAGVRNANVSAMEYGAGRGVSGVDLRWHPHKEFKKLTSHQQDELRDWMKTQEGKKLMKESRKTAAAAKRKNDSSSKESDSKNGGGNWKKKMKKALKTPQGIKTVMSVLAEEESNNQALVCALRASNTPAPAPAPAAATPPAMVSSVSATSMAFPATSVKLQSILKKKSE